MVELVRLAPLVRQDSTPALIIGPSPCTACVLSQPENAAYPLRTLPKSKDGFLSLLSLLFALPTHKLASQKVTMSEYDPTKIPLSVAPPGQSNDVNGGPSQAWMPRLAIYTTLPVAVGFVSLRVYARLKLRIPFGWDDGKPRPQVPASPCIDCI